MKKALSLLLLALTLSACGTLQTIPNSNANVGDVLSKNKSHCKSIPRIYSGVAYDFCRLNADRGDGLSNYAVLGLYVFDISLLAPLLDTALLPVSITQQIIVGSIEIEHATH
jgi:uncharacterized protein YceK